MSLMHALTWLFDRTTRVEEQAKHERWLRPTQTPDPGTGPAVPPRLDALPPRRVRCRCCGRRSVDTRFCLACLAETMVPVDGRPPG